MDHHLIVCYNLPLQQQNQNNLLNFNLFTSDNPRNKCLSNSSIYRANQLWQTLPSEIKGFLSLQLFKDKIKLGGAIDVNVRFAQDILPMSVTFTFVFLWFKVDAKQNFTVVNSVNDLYALFQLKQCTCHLGYGQIFLAI